MYFCKPLARLVVRNLRIQLHASPQINIGEGVTGEQELMLVTSALTQLKQLDYVVQQHLVSSSKILVFSLCKEAVAALK
jgi:hypothetical protein